MFNSCIFFVFCAAKNMPVMHCKRAVRLFFAAPYQKFM